MSTRRVSFPDLMRTLERLRGFCEPEPGRYDGGPPVEPDDPLRRAVAALLSPNAGLVRRDRPRHRRLPVLIFAALVELSLADRCGGTFSA